MADFPPVTIYFQDPTITELFSDLIAVRGVPTRPLSSLDGLAPGTKIITEVGEFQKLAPGSYDKCLIVGNKDALEGLEVLTLSRPLTEEKIESALNQFLRK